MRKLTDQETRRIEDLLGRMTLEEKTAQLTGASLLGLMDEAGRLAPDKMEARLGAGVGQITLSAGATALSPEQTAQNAAVIQRFLVENTRLGIPAIFNDECVAGFVAMGATHFPQAIGMGAAWNPDLTRRMAAVIGRQARAVGSHLMYSPVLDLGVDPRWGRIEETWGEDPYLASRIAVAFVEGLQSDDLRRGVVATLKHFAAHGAPEGGRNCAPVHVGARDLRDTFLLPFEAAVKEGGAESVMAAYHDLDGIPCASSKELLTDILRGEWDFPGIVVADWGVVEMLQTFHHVAADPAEAGMLALAAGLDVETPERRCYDTGMLEAVRQGKFPEAILDRAVRRHLRVKTLLGLFEEPYISPVEASAVFDTPAQRALALEAARATMTLLRNEGPLLPLRRDLRSVAVIGPNADDTHALLGDYSYTIYRGLKGDAVKMVNVLEGIRNKVSAGTKILHAPGCDVMGPSTAGFAQALEAARAADVVVAVVGGRSALHRDGTSGENLDRAELGLPGVQEELLRQVHALGKPVVAVVLEGRPPALEWLAANVPAILMAWRPGEEGGTAVADALFGDANPGGKLPVSMLRAAGQAPTPYHVRPSSFAESARYVFTDRAPLYPFGHGLSYTTFGYAALTVEPAEVDAEDEVRISCVVHNTGDRAGDEVVQLYVRDPVATVARPRLELKGFGRIGLLPGEKRTVTFRLPVESLAFHNVDMRRVAEAGAFEVMVGSSSEDIRLRGEFRLGATRDVRRRRFETEVSVQAD